MDGCMNTTGLNVKPKTKNLQKQAENYCHLRGHKVFLDKIYTVQIIKDNFDKENLSK